MARNDNLNYEIGGILGGSAEGNQGIYEESSTAKYPLGQKLELIDGRVFRYANFDAACTVGKLVGPDFSTGGAVEISDGTISNGGAGSTVVTLTASGSSGPPADFQGVSANDYAGSYLHITDDAGEGFTYRIKTNGAASSDAVEFTLYDPIITALSTGATDFAITPGPFNNVHAATAGTDFLVSGVTMVSMTSGYFGWIQTKGIATCLADNAWAVGQQLTTSDGVAGAVQPKDAQTEPIVGYALAVVADTEYGPLMLNGLAD